MDFDLSAEQRKRYLDTVEFARAELGAPSGGGFCRQRWQSCADFGIHGMAVPPEYGGAGLDTLTIAVTLEALGYGSADCGLLFAIGGHMWSCVLPVLQFGTAEQRSRYLLGLCDGSLIGAHAVTEPDAGSDATALRTTADEHDHRVVLNGRKRFITNAPVADLFVVFASSDPRQLFAGISAYLVERDTGGLVVGAPEAKLGLDTAAMGELELVDCTIPDHHRLGRRGGGMAMFGRAMQWERTFILASAVGTMQRQLEQCLRHASRREQFGRPVGQFQAVAHRIVEMQRRLETSRLLLYRQAWRLGHGTAMAGDAAMVKLHLSECLVANSLDALHIHGGGGYLAGTDTERDVRDALASRLYSGTSEIQRNLIAQGLGL